MRIIKPGRPVPSWEYICTCEHCGCEFAVTVNELSIDFRRTPSSAFYGQAEDLMEDMSYVACPTCNAKVFRNAMRIEESPQKVSLR